MTEICYAFLNSNPAKTSHGDDKMRLMCAVLFFISVCGLIFIATTIMFNKKLQTPPQPMIAWICIAEACMSYNALIEVINPLYFICYTESYHIFSESLFRFNVAKGSGEEV